MHTVKRVCTLVLTGLLALPMAAPAGAAAASFSDLPSSHWAYIAMTEAAGYGILQGTGANTMSPSAPLTWPQFLAMAARPLPRRNMPAAPLPARPGIRRAGCRPERRPAGGAGRGRADRGGHPPGCRGGALQRSAGGIYPLLLGSAD